MFDGWSLKKQDFWYLHTSGMYERKSVVVGQAIYSRL